MLIIKLYYMVHSNQIVSTWPFRCWNNQLVSGIGLTRVTVWKYFYFICGSHTVFCVFLNIKLSFHCCCTRSDLLCCHSLIMTAKTGWKYVNLTYFQTGGQTVKNKEETICETNVRRLIFLFLPKKSYPQKCCFIMANLRATSRSWRTNFKKNI